MSCFISPFNEVEMMIDNFHRARHIECGGNGKKYNISIGLHLLSELPQIIQHTLGTRQVSKWIILTDQNVHRLYGATIHRVFQPHPYLLRQIPAGEASKSRQTKSQVEEWMLAQECQRDSLLIAIGGGVVGDLGGFIAATYMRGIPFIQVPTTLLACVDSSIGGKTGIDSPKGKNLIGAFHAPLAVIIDLSVLATLPRREFINGMAEIIKAAAIRSPDLFDFLEAQVDQILAYDQQTKTDETTNDNVMSPNDIPLHLKMVGEMIFQSAQIKAQVVLADELEHGLRSILNFGHSIGHGIEALLQPHWLHGECVAMGMIKELEIARRRGICSDVTVGRLLRCLKLYGLPTRVPAQVSSNAVIEKMGVDKKNTGGQKRMILLESIGTVYTTSDSSQNGRPQITHTVTDDDIRLALEPRLELVPGPRAMGKLHVPGSKSISNRILLLAALGRGSCAIDGLLHSDDTQVMIRALSQLGASITWQNQGQRCVISGTAGHLVSSRAKTSEIYLSNAGTAFRFLTSAVASLVTTTGDDDDAEIVLTGNHRMKERPIGPLVEALTDQKCKVRYLGESGFPPLGIQTGCQIAGGELKLAGKVSSQYVSSILLSAPYARAPVTLQLEEELPTSLPYILLTLELMKTFGIDVKQVGLNRFEIPTGVYVNPPEVLVEADASSATYPLAMAAITGGDVTVLGLGNKSTQGDAQFHLLLREMGCTTSQTPESTRVQVEPGTILCAFERNMENMTDAFMTAAVLAVVAKGRTEITGIANQRVKECNRIEVMVTELLKIGISCGELEDGLWISGLGIPLGQTSSLVKNFPVVAIQCHNDHRIAMSFAVLSAAIPNIVISDKECTDKTYPAFWDDCETKLGLVVRPVVNMPQSKEIPSVEDRDTTESPTVYFIGMRGVGKTQLGQRVAQRLGWTYLDMDTLLTGSGYLQDTIAHYVHEHGWPAFRQQELACLESIMRQSPRNTLVSTGGGIIEGDAGQRLLTKYPYVVHLSRGDMDSVLDFCASINNKEDVNRPELDSGNSREALAKLWQRREPLYRSCSHFDFRIDLSEEEEEGDGRWNQATAECHWFITHRVLSSKCSKSESSKLITAWDTFFLSLTYPKYTHLDRDVWTQLTADVQALELRTDLLESLEPDFIQAQIAAIRQMSKLPLIVTVRSKEQGGNFGGSEREMFHLLQRGVRCGAEFVDVESVTWSWTTRQHFLDWNSEYPTKVISSYHAIQRPIRSIDQMSLWLEEIRHFDQVDVIKLVVLPVDEGTCIQLANLVRSSTFSGPVIALATTPAGTLSRVLNRQLTPVTHPLVPCKAAPGQLSVKDILTLRQTLGCFQEPKVFTLFGMPITNSPSPEMHNAGFEFLGRSQLCQYVKRETASVQDVQQTIHDRGFGGASVTIPLKVDVMQVCDELSQAAQAIGAVNTLVVLDSGEGVLGDNTDWIGISRPIAKRLSERGQEPSKSKTALILGAGGTAMAACYAMSRLKMNLLIYNRTLSKAQALAARYPRARVISKSEMSEISSDLAVIIGTIPASVQTLLPQALFTTSCPVVFDAAYFPRMTTLLTQAQACGCVIVPGAEMLYEQALEQFRLWTHTEIPLEIMASKCYAKLEEMEGVLK